MEERRAVYRVLVGKPRERNHFENSGVDGRLVLMDLQEVGLGVMDWIESARDRDRWQARVNAVMNLRGLD
jgi:hypothetical protein